MEAKTAESTKAIMTEIVLPNDTNTLGNLMGGRLLHLMDICSAISAHRCSKRMVVTASVNNVSFASPIKLGDIITLESKVTRTFNSSMEILIQVFVEDHRTGKKTLSNNAYYTFVAVDQIGTPIEVPDVTQETEAEKLQFEGALRRRQLSLILAGKMKASDATELKKLFN
ncbi:MAG: acyl-CoA thioesterase [Flavobacteriales bacterium]|nr:MAG: acyl-CoA thioesterase [Flavobacteriales bacterium]